MRSVNINSNYETTVNWKCESLAWFFDLLEQRLQSKLCELQARVLPSDQGRPRESTPVLHWESILRVVLAATFSSRYPMMEHFV